MLDVPAGLQRRVDRFDPAVQIAIDVTQAAVTEMFPGQDRRIPEQNTPRRDVVPVGWPDALVARAETDLQFKKPFPRLFHADPLPARLTLAVRAKAPHGSETQRV
jgi:hypothetical protein